MPADTQSTTIRLTRADLKELEKWKKSLFLTCGKVSNSQAIRMAIRKLNALHKGEKAA